MILFQSTKVLFYLNFFFANINIELRHNVPTSQRSNIEQERDRILTLGESIFCRPGGVPIKNCEIAIFLHFHVYIYIYIYIYIRRLRRFCVMFSLRKSYQTIPLGQSCPKGQSAKCAKYYQQTSHNFNKTAVCSHSQPSGHFCTGM